MIFADLELAKRLEAAEAYGCAEFATARKLLDPHSSAAWMNYAGTTAVFDGPDSPITQTFGLGIYEGLSTETLDVIEKFFRDRGAVAMHEVCPFSGANTLELLCRRGYRPFEISNVMYRAVEETANSLQSNLRVRIINADEALLWSSVSARGWAHEHPEIEEFVHGIGAVCVARQNSPCFLAEIDGVPGAAGTLILHEGVALFGGAATSPELRRRGLQAALLQERMRYAAEKKCDLAMMVAEAGSNSQRNAERKGFRVAYTRLKWRLNISDTT
jgi:GNAT superfamily N-acetyltransferase